MMSSNLDLEPQCLHSHNPSTASINTFASSSCSTLASLPPSPSSSNYKERTFQVQEHEVHESLLHIPQRPHWRKTPLTTRGLLSLLIRLIVALLSSLIPSFLRRNTQPRKLYPTSYLDGLRGVAALIVFVDHLMIPWFEDLRYGYGSSPENYYLLQLPIVRLLYSGRASVGVFFVISGYVLSSKPLELIHSRRYNEVATVLSSSTFRRGIRLYLPAILGTLVSMIIAGNGWYLNVPAQTATLPPNFDTWGEQVQNWVDSTMELIFPFREVDLQSPYSPAYNGHLWTIPVEFFGSLLVFIVILGLSGVRTKWRMSIMVSFAGWALIWGRWDVFLFLGGLFLAEVNVISKMTGLEASLPLCYGSAGPPQSFSISSPSICLLLRPLRNLKPTLDFCVLVLSLYLLSFTVDTPPLTMPFSAANSDLTTLPSDSSTILLSPKLKPQQPNHGVYYQSLPNFIPTTYDTLWNGSEFFFVSLGSVLFVYCLSSSRTLQKPFNTNIAQYLGDVSYSLYIIHGMIVFSLGTHLQRRWTGGVNFGPWIPPVESSNAEDGAGIAPVKDILGWGVPGTYGAGVIFNRGEAMSSTDSTGGFEAIEDGKNALRYGKAFFVAAVLNGVMVFWIADLFWRGVDKRCVRFGRRVEGWLCRRQ